MIQQTLPLQPFSRFYLATLGCKINQYESQALREAWTARGLIETQEIDDAQLVLVNSCAVTARAVRDLRHTVRSTHRANPQARIIVTGCTAQIQADEIAQLPGVMGVVPQERKASLLDPFSTPDNVEYSGFELTIGDYNRARAVVKIQDGCSHRCTYCIVPITRGPARTREPKEILKEIQRLLHNGFREIIISGINLRQYGMGLEEQLGTHDKGRAFWNLIAYLNKELTPQWADRARLRLSSLDPGQLTDQALDVLDACSILCPQLHVSLQCASPAVLKKMGRGHYHPAEVADFIQKYARVAHESGVFGLGADLLVGFPGETEKHFKETLDFCREFPLSYAHVFPYSKRPGTPAEHFPGHVDTNVKKERAAQLRHVANDKKHAFMHKVATLEHVDVALQSLTPAKGVCEFYTTCVFEEPLIGTCEKALVRAKPVAVKENKILVRPVA